MVGVMVSSIYLCNISIWF